jgi:uncharacterized protein YndB with AHSA1/START domain
MMSTNSTKRMALGLALMALAPLAHAEVKESSADAFFLSYEEPVAAPTMTAYAALTQIGKWWDGEHTYSGKAANLTLKADAGGCLCERWKDGSVEHGVVLMAMPGKVLRLRTALGPLQERALNGILTFWLKNENSATTLTVEYRVTGASTSALDQLAPSVDDVLGAQVDRLRRYIATGNPEPPPAEKVKAAAAATVAKDEATDADIAARVDELRREIQDGSSTPPAAVVNIPMSDKAKAAQQKAANPQKPPEHP